MACMECADCGHMCNQAQCPECGSKNMVWDEAHLPQYDDDNPPEEEDDEI